MNYETMLRAEASKTVEGLALTVAKLKKQIASVEDRIRYERADVDRRAENLTHFKESAAAKLATSTSAYREWQNRFRRLTLDLAAARDGLALLETVIAPKTKLAMQEARGKLSQALAAACLAVRPAAEAEMARLLDVVVAEHDLYIDASKRLHEDHGCAFVLPAFYHPGGPRCQHSRIARVGKHLLTDSAMYLAFTLPPAPATPAPQAAPVDVPDGQAPLGAAISDAVDSHAAPDAPGTTPTTTPDTGAVPDAAPTAAPGVEKSAQAASGATNGDGADALPYPPEDSEKKATRPPTILTGDVAGTDPDAPPDAGEI